jgi:hypothetical protein
MLAGCADRCSHERGPCLSIFGADQGSERVQVSQDLRVLLREVQVNERVEIQ